MLTKIRLSVSIASFAGNTQMNRTTHNKGKKLPPEPLTQREVIALMNACRRAPTGKRDRALICVMWRAQLRISEALALKPSDFDPCACTLRVLSGKGGKHRVAVLDAQGCAELLAWLRERDKLGVSGHQPIFCTLRGARMNAAQVREKLPRLARKVGIAKRVHAHGLRHTHASELAREGVPMNVIQAQLGHSSLSTTDRYIRHIAPGEVIETMRLRSWQL